MTRTGCDDMLAFFSLRRWDPIFSLQAEAGTLSLLSDPCEVQTLLPAMNTIR